MDKYDNFFEDICSKYYKDVLKYLNFVIKDNDAANDIVQETFIVVYNNIKKVYTHKNIGGFIFKTAQNLAKNYKKQLYKKLVKEIYIDENIMQIQDSKGTIENLIDSDINEWDYITDILDYLSYDKRKLYKMYYIDHKSMKDISNELNFEYAALRMKYVRLRREIKELVKNLAEEKFVT